MRSAFGVDHPNLISKAGGVPKPVKMPKAAQSQLDLAMGAGPKVGPSPASAPSAPKPKASAAAKKQQVGNQLGLVGEAKGVKIPGVDKVTPKPIGAPVKTKPAGNFNAQNWGTKDYALNWGKKNWKPLTAAGGTGAAGVAGGSLYANRNR